MDYSLSSTAFCVYHIPRLPALHHLRRPQVPCDTQRVAPVRRSGRAGGATGPSRPRPNVGAVARGPPGRPANHVPKTLQDRMFWACRAGDVGTRSYGGAMPIGMVTCARMRAYHAINGAAPLPRQG